MYCSHHSMPWMTCSPEGRISFLECEENSHWIMYLRPMNLCSSYQWFDDFGQVNKLTMHNRCKTHIYTSNINRRPDSKATFHRPFIVLGLWGNVEGTRTLRLVLHLGYMLIAVIGLIEHLMHFRVQMHLRSNMLWRSILSSWFEHGIKLFYSSFRFCLRDVLLADPALRRPHLSARQEQDVQAGVHPQHAERRRSRCKN